MSEPVDEYRPTDRVATAMPVTCPECGLDVLIASAWTVFRCCRCKANIQIVRFDDERKAS